MKPYYEAPDGQRIYVGDVRDVLRGLPDESVQMCVTSPPYWGLRDYGTATWEGGDEKCEHVQTKNLKRGNSGGFGNKVIDRGVQSSSDSSSLGYRSICARCGARRIDQQIGLEATPDAYIATMVEVFAEVRRVLRSDGVCFANFGDSYASGKGTCYNPGGGDNSLGQERKEAGVHPLDRGSVTSLRASGLKPKDLCGIPWRVAFALQADGWWLRSAITWAKRAPMPESVTDRPTSATEMIFLLAKAATYYYDAPAVAEPSTDSESLNGRNPRNPYSLGRDDPDGFGRTRVGFANIAEGKTYPTRNQRNFWLLGPEPYAEAHFATFPTEIPRRAILAGSSERGCCPKCGRAWERVVERVTLAERAVRKAHGEGPPKHLAMIKLGMRGRNGGLSGSNSHNASTPTAPEITTLGFRAACACDAGEPVPQTVLDPFLGSGTTLLVARQLGRRGIGIELNPAYADLAMDRLEGQTLSMFALEAAT